MCIRDSDNSESDIAYYYGVSSFPFFVVIDDSGIVILRIPGRLGVETLEQLLDAISQLGVRN